MKKVLESLGFVAVLAAALVVAAGAEARIVRSQSARTAFAKAVTCPATGRNRLPCPGYVIDHVVPLACGGADAPGNMQWQTLAEGKAKDRVERVGCTKR